MRSLTILTLIALAFIVSENCVRGQTRVIGGKPAALGMFPYQALLYTFVADNIFSYKIDSNRSYINICGGSLISKNFVVTAGHCLKFRKPLYFDKNGSLHVNTNETILGRDVSVYLGIVDLYNCGIDQCQSFYRLDQSHFIIHPGFHFKNNTNDPIEAYNDIALIRLPRPAETNGSYVKPIQLPVFNEITTKGNAIIVGFGGFNEPHDPLHINENYQLLRYVDVETLTNLECGIDEPTQICTRGRKNNTNVGVYHGDSGGPLVVRSNGSDTLVGIASYLTGGGSLINGYSNSHFTRVTSYLEWIHENTNTNI